MSTITQPDPEKSHSDATQITEIVSSANGLAQHETVDKTPEEAAAEKRFVRKVDWIVLPLLGCMYFLASLDKGDIGNAAVAGMTDELKLSPQMYSNAVSLFYVGYILFQLPGDVFLRKITPPIQLGVAITSWGVFTCILCKANTYGTLIAMRMLIGCAEAFLQAGPLYLTLYYKRTELASRAAIFFSTSAIAGAFNGIISYGISINLNHVSGWLAWRWIFLIEGLMSVFFGFVVLAFLPPVPEKLRWGWTENEKKIAIRRSKEAFNIIDASVKSKQLLEVLKDPKSYMYTALHCCTSVSLACFTGFLPVIVKSFGYTTLNTQLLTIPVYAVTTISILSFGFLTDKLADRGTRGLMVMITFLIAGFGWFLLLVSKSQGLSYFATFCIGAGTLPSIVLNQTWLACNVIGFTKRAGNLAFMNVFAQSLAIGATQVYSDAPHYYRGNGFAMGSMVIGIIVVAALQYYLRWMNEKKRANQYSPEAEINRKLSIEEIEDRHPDFFYTP